MSHTPGHKPPPGGCPSYDTLRAFVHGRLDAEEILQVASHLYMQCCPRCSEALLAMPETSASVLGPVTPSLPDDPELTTDEVRPQTVGARLGGNGYHPLRLGRYTIRGQVGKGGFGTVYAAHDEELDRVVAVKVPFARRFSPAEQGKASAEAKLHASLDHPNIVPIYDVGKTEEIPFFFVSKLIVGKDLAARMQEEVPLTCREAAELVLLLAGALDYLHARGLIHRDIKPRNILLDEAGTPYLVDFGLAKAPVAPVEGHPDDNLIAGTLPYMSPEQARGENQSVDRRTDLYALGVVFYELLTGQRPFRGGTVALLDQIKNAAPAPPRSLVAEVPRDLEAVCLKAMAKDARVRYQGAGELAEDLRLYLAGEPLRYARRVGAAERAWSWVRRNRRVAALGVVAGTALAAALLMALWRPTELQGSRAVSPEAVRTVPVMLATNPFGADLTWFPLDPRTGEPQPTRGTRGKAGVQVELPPGPYLVVAVLEGKPGEEPRFHEVYRNVPAAVGMAGPFRHHKVSYSQGVALLQPVNIPMSDAARGMCLFPGSQDFRMGSAELPFAPPHLRRVPAFFLDTAEVTVEAFHRNLDNRAFFAKEPKQLDHPITGVTWDLAVNYAERVGKRLPDEAEYEFAATEGGKRRFPWGDPPPPLVGNTWPMGPVRRPEFDKLQLPGQPAVYGLYSNVVEWTSSWPDSYPGTEAADSDPKLRVIRGGPMEVAEGKYELQQPVTGPKERFSFVFATGHQPGLGFRCARSARPRLKPEDFGAALRR